jgi:hypothetical protein
VQENWESNVVEPYKNWDVNKLSSYLRAKGREVQAGAKDAHDGLIDQVKATWYETGDKSAQAWEDVKEWTFDTWSDSQLKAFCDKQGINVPQPKNRDVVIAKIRANYETAARKAGETAAYPGDWLYSTWSSK